MTNSPSSDGWPGSGPDTRTRNRLVSNRGPDSVVVPRSGPVLEHPRDLPGQAEPGVSDGDRRQARSEIDES
jgi:hypothetical protein